MTRRYEREILELVERKERENRGRERVARARRSLDQARHRAAAPALRERLGPGGWLVASLGLAILAFALQTVVPLVAAFMALAAVACFFAPIIVGADGTGLGSRRWRGQVIDLPPRDGPFHGLRYRLWQIKQTRRRRYRDRNR